MNRRRFVRSSLAAAVAASLPVRSGLAALLGPSATVDADINAITGDGAQVTLRRAAVQELADSLRGNLLLPGHEAYESARHIINASIDKHPALIVQCKGVADVRNAVDFARESSLLTAVKCGGHSHSGKSTCNGGMMIDLSTFRSVDVDPTAQIAHVSGGSLLGDMDHETMAFGLVTTAGTVSHTGVGGLTLGGGFGRLARRFGLALDNVRGFEVITADGQYRRANASENPDLYWGLRGGGGNFGVVTSFGFQLHEMQREVIGGMIGFPAEQARDILNFYADYSLEAPDELALDLVMFGNTRTGNLITFSICYSGPQKQAESILNKIRSAGAVVMDTVGAIDYVALQKSGDISDPRAIGSYTKSGFLAELSPAFIDTIVSGFAAREGLNTVFAMQQCGGAIGRVAPDATAFPHRSINYIPLLIIDWPIGADASEHVAWLKAYWKTIEPHIQGFYTNDLIDESQEQVNSNYLGNYSKLVALKNKYDPINLFRLNANIIPTI
jgi:FAD binding domain/Berberine and berberine like